MQSIKMKEELFWDREPGSVSPDIEIERAINFGGFDFIEEVNPYAPTAVGHGPTASYGVWVRGSVDCRGKPRRLSQNYRRSLPILASPCFY
jgi:hypothetical protein